MPWLRWLDASVTIRLGFAVLTSYVAVVTESMRGVLPWLLLVVAIDLVIVALNGMPVARRGVMESLVTTLLAFSAAAAGAAFALVGVGAALIILIPAYHAGTRYGRFGFLLTSTVGGATFLLAEAVFQPEGGITAGLLPWILAASVLGVLGAWNQRLAAEQAEADSDPAAREAIELIERLHDLSAQMATGLDAPASATLALDMLAAEVPSTRSAVLVTGDAEHLVPVALRGSTRAPWSVAEQVAELLHQGPSGWKPTEISFTDDLGPRKALLVPCGLGNGSTAVLVAERPKGQAFTAQERQCAAEITQRVAPTIQAGLLFGALRQVATIEERGRIARDIHDGIAQELAALGYRIDALRMQASGAATPMRDGLDALRGSLGDVMADLRMDITELRLAERPGSGLGAVLGAAVQSFGSVTGVRTTVTVSGGQRRLDPRLEILVHRLVMDVLADAQASGARNASVTLTTSIVGPAKVEITHDGNPRTARRTYRDPDVDGLDAYLVVQEDSGGRTTVTLTVEESSPVGAAREMS
jgi:signal transduction histidine kinase